ncbi:MAG: phosphoadenosine phosphosulfate reductase family protein [Bacteroidaceae bacterium]|nr:phosphoadenosine phosphosulfate reductase family protein [Bacteroidaceae bacterium]
MTLMEQTHRTIDAVRVSSDSVIVFCSLGKDSLVTLDLIYPKFNRIVCVFMYFVPHLEHIENWVNWVKTRYPKVEFMQVPHWNLSYILRGGLYCVPNPKVKLIKLADVIKAIRLKTGIGIALLGMKKADGMNRRLMLKGYEGENYIHNGCAYPLADWTQKDVLAYMKQAQLPEPIRYSLKASSGTGFNIDCFLWLRENFPQDLQTIYKVFPMSERILFEYDNAQKK